MSSIIEIANGVAEKLSDYNAEVSLAPEFELRKMQEMRVVVVPTGKKREFLTRSAYETGDVIEVAVIHKCREIAAVGDLVALVEKIGSDLLGTRVGNSLCAKANWEPLFAIEELRSNGLFISVIQFLFKEMR